MLLLYPISFLLYFDQNSLIKSVEEVNASSLACIEKDRVMYCEFGGGLSKTYLGPPASIKMERFAKTLNDF